MITVRNEKVITFEDGKIDVIAEIDVDTRAELPLTEELDGRVLHQGSTAYIIHSGEVAVLDGSGKWFINGEEVTD